MTKSTTTALVTGATRGLGFEIVRQLGERGITAIVGARDELRGKVVADGLGQPYVQLDVTDPVSVSAAADWIEREYGALDILVNNAGIDPPPDLPSTTSVDLVRHVYETNVFGVITVTNAMLPLVRKSAAGRIVNQSSLMGSITTALDREHPIWPQNKLAYNSSKSALNMITVAYAKELWDTPIKVNAVDPGWCATEINGYTGYRTAEQGGAIAVRAATLGADGPTGAYLDDEGPLPW